MFNSFISKKKSEGEHEIYEMIVPTWLESKTS